MKDAEIVDLYGERNEAAIQQTQQKYGAYLSKIAYNILSDFENSRECVNDTYLLQDCRSAVFAVGRLSHA